MLSEQALEIIKNKTIELKSVNHSSIGVEINFNKGIVKLQSMFGMIFYLKGIQANEVISKFYSLNDDYFSIENDDTELDLYLIDLYNKKDKEFFSK